MISKVQLCKAGRAETGHDRNMAHKLGPSAAVAGHRRAAEADGAARFNYQFPKPGTLEEMW
jgi:hypothetical protein